jgi:alpha-amylase
MLQMQTRMNKYLAHVFLALAFMALHGGAISSEVAGDTSTSHIEAKKAAPFLWENATVYFLLTDRFNNADKSNDLSYGRRADAATLRGYMGGDLAGVTQKINEGYFNRLGVNAIWITPPVEQIHGGTDEGTGKSYAFHGYWTKDFTKVDANLGTEKDFKRLVETAHAHGIRVLLDVVMNHLGPVTEIDPTWPSDWVRTGPTCDYKNADGAIKCTLVKNLPDILTESNQAVELPPTLVAKWKQEGRYAKEVKELDDFFARTKFPRAPRYYLIKWHADWIRKYGVDGFRVDTVKHVEAPVWKELKTEALLAYEEWKTSHPKDKLGDQAFFMTAEAYNYAIADGQLFKMDGGTRINYYENGFDSMINFGFKYDANSDYETLFSQYAKQLHGDLKNYSVLNYISSHDDGSPFDPDRKKPFEAATKLLLSPGAAQIYYGDELARELRVPNATGDANLRSMLNWKLLNGQQKIPQLEGGKTYRDLLGHWQKLALFRQAHPAVGAGDHHVMRNAPYVFSRTLQSTSINDRVVVALDLPVEKMHAISVAGVFEDGKEVKDYYSGERVIVKNGLANLNGKNSIVLLGLE